ncbi:MULTISPECIES: DUF4286 family protein [unclassified Caballeronia]|uniref:DUF4286 family protein n=1 Tax=unclassified Caballeronia TaxID=2646786 RepID=UPI002027AD45|nr:MULTISPECIES: DUF4286 family protein [unclassified Caballeronia]
MTTRTQAMVVIRHDVDADTVDEYLRWHSFEHLPERLALPGFRHAERWERISGDGPRYLCVIDVDSARDLESPAYLARLDAPTEWTRKLMPHYRNVQRALCETLVDVGGGLAPFQWCMRFDLEQDVDIGDTIRELRDAHALTRVRLGRVHDALSGRQTEEKRMRGTEDTGGFGHLLFAGALTRNALECGAAAMQDALGVSAADCDRALFRFSYASTA